MLSRRAFGASFTACASVGSASTPTMRALLVGVTEYPRLAPSLQLKGPPKFDTFAALWPPLKLANPLPDKHLQDSAG